MSRLDLVVFGATGYTGRRAVEQLAEGGARYAGVTWAVAGRSKAKLDELLAETSKKTGVDVTSTEVIIADVSDAAALERMCARARCVVNACGPYRHYGEPVVRAAILAKTHYVDVSGEPEFIERMQLEYDEAARAAGVRVVSACGFDSIPNDMGVAFLEQNFPGTLSTVESYMSNEIKPEYAWEAFRGGCINYGTWESLVYSLANYNELVALRKKLFPDRMPTFLPKLENRGAIHRSEGGYCVPFLGADNSIVYRTQRALFTRDHKRPVHFRCYLKLGLLQVLLLSLFGSVVLLFSKYSFTRKLLLNHPRLFSCGTVTRGPATAVTANTAFTVLLRGRGWRRGQDVDTTKPDTVLDARVHAMDPGYGFTALALLQSAYTIVREEDKMPKEGGVMTTGVAFRDTSLIRRLQESGVTIELVDRK